MALQVRYWTVACKRRGSNPTFTNLSLFCGSLSIVTTTMLAVLIGIVLLHILNLIILIISTSVNAWRTQGKNSYDLWNFSTEDWIQAVQALMILATVFCLLSLILFVYQLFTMAKGGRFFFTGTFQIISSLFVMSGAIIYTVMNPYELSCGYAFVLAWLAFPLTLISGLIYIILRKKE